MTANSNVLTGYAEHEMPASARLRESSEGTLSVLMWADADVRAGELRGYGVNAYDIVLIAINNTDDALERLVALWRIGAIPLVLSTESPSAEVTRLSILAGAKWIWRAEARLPQLSDGYDVHASSGSGAYLVTSGSTGTTKLVFRDEASLLAEGRRYMDGLGMSAEDIVLLPLPISHAFAFGVALSALLAKAELLLVRPTALGEIEERLRKQATMAFLSPTLARLLASRRSGCSGAHINTGALKFAMVGAGAVDEYTEAKFQEVFGMGLARNYGSTELGAVFAGLPPLPPLCIGSTLPGVEFRIETDGNGETGALWVRSSAGEWVATGDFAHEAEGRVTVLGRQSASIRRGDRWISPLEIETAIRASGQVRDVFVRKAAGQTTAGNERIAAELVPLDGSSFDKKALMEYLRSVLAPYKIPDVVHVRSCIARNAQGKVVARPRYAMMAGNVLAAAQAYKRAELVFALMETGVLALLADGVDAADLADRYGLNLDSAEAMLDVARGLCLVVPAAEHEGRGQLDAIRQFLELEELLSRRIVTRHSIADFLRNGVHGRFFELTDHADELRGVYTEAMHGRIGKLRVRLALNKINVPSGARVLEIASGPGRYVEEILGKHAQATGVLATIGHLSGTPSEIVRTLEHTGRLKIVSNLPRDLASLDLIVIDNAIHHESVMAELEWLLDRLASGGVLLIDDIFLPEFGAGNEIALDWFTHGAHAVMRIEELTARLAALGRDAVVRSVPGDELHQLVFIQSYSTGKHQAMRLVSDGVFAAHP